MGRSVPLSAFDVLRLVDALRVAWSEVALVGVAFSGGFRLDPTATRWNFRLRQRPSGRCVLAVGEEYLRCGVHAVRPSSCRVYPFYVGLRDDGPRVGLGNNAVCPPSLGRLWAELAAPHLVEPEIAEQGRMEDVIARWEAQLAKKSDADEFLRFAREAM